MNILLCVFKPSCTIIAHEQTGRAEKSQPVWNVLQCATRVEAALWDRGLCEATVGADPQEAACL